MRISVHRRGFIASLAGLATLAGWRPTSAAQVITRAAPAATMQAMVDTLLPADEQPSGSSLGTDAALLQAGAQDAGLGDLIIQGTDWLDRRAHEVGGTAFASLDASAREALLTEAEQAAAESVPHRFFHAMHHLAIRHYYAQPGAWPGLGYAGPPQPLGFPTHAKPPAATAS